MKKVITTIVVFLLIVNVLCSPVTFLNCKEKIIWVSHQPDFKKIKIKIDSIRVNTGFRKSPSYTLYYDRDKHIILPLTFDALLLSKEYILRGRSALNYLEMHNNDSLLIWYHPTIRGRYALEEETEMNIDGFVQQIIINIILLLTALYCIIWQIKSWRKYKKNSRNEEN